MVSCLKPQSLAGPPGDPVLGASRQTCPWDSRAHVPASRNLGASSNYLVLFPSFLAASLPPPQGLA